jgi:hypothetical protein
MNWRYGALLVGAVLVAGCGTAGQSMQGTGTVQQTGTVQGTFERAGGPAIPTNGKIETPVVPLSGTVTFTGAGGQKFSVSVGSSGAFSMQLAAGSYAVSGVSGQIGEGGLACSAPVTAHVQAGETAHILVVCPVP